MTSSSSLECKDHLALFPAACRQKCTHGNDIESRLAPHEGWESGHLFLAIPTCYDLCCMQPVDYSILFPYTTDDFCQEHIHNDRRFGHHTQVRCQIRRRKKLLKKIGNRYPKHVQTQHWTGEIKNEKKILSFTCCCKPIHRVCHSVKVYILQVLTLSKPKLKD